MLSLAVAVVVIALPDCINPSLIAAELFLAAEERPGWRTVVFTVAVWTVTFLVGLALALGLGDLILSILPKPGATLKYTLMLAAGLVLVAGGTIVWFRRDALASSGASPGSGNHSEGSPVLLGAGIGALETLTAFPYFAAIALIVGSSVGASSKLFLLVLYCVVYTLPLIAIAILCVVRGARAEQLLQPVIGWLFARWPLLTGPLMAVVGVGLAVYGIVRL